MGTLVQSHLPSWSRPNPAPAAFLVALHDTGHEVINHCLSCVCVCGKTSHQPLAGLLNPLPLLRRGLPSSNGHTIILRLVDCFSKAVQFVPLTKLSSAAGTGVLFVYHVLRLHGILVSDRGSQFTSQVWRSFCTALRVAVSLSTGYHPQSNGQMERAIQSLESMLRCVSAKHPASWSSFLP